MTMEPSDVGPKFGGDLSATDSDRRLVVQLLDAALRDGRLTAQDHAVRTSQAMQAYTFDDLVPLTRDLTAAAAPLPRAYTPVPAPSSPARFVGIFSGPSRRGAWVVPSEIQSLALFGGVTIDLTDAIWTSDTIEVNLAAMFGGITITVPAGVEVVDQTVCVFGGTDVKSTRVAPGGRRLIVKGFCAFGGVEVKGPKDATN